MPFPFNIESIGMPPFRPGIREINDIFLRDEEQCFCYNQAKLLARVSVKRLFSRKEVLDF